MAAILEDGRLRLTGYVGDYYYEDGFTSSDVVLALGQVDDGSDLTVHINSGGGVASEGAAIHALFKARSGVTNIVVEGIAASAASLIAMAGKTVTMSAGSVLMIHDPGGYAFGNAEQLGKTIEALEALGTAYSRVYAAKSGKTPEECRDIMKAERWFTPQQAVEEGFANATTEDVSPPVAAFDYRLYAHAPQQLTALASEKNWRVPGADKKAAPAATSHEDPKKEMTMGNQNGGDKSADTARIAVDAYKARRKAVMTLPEAKGREALAEALLDTDLDEAAIKVALSAAPVATAETSDAVEFEQRRLNGEGLNRGGGQAPQAKGDKAVLTASVDRLNKRRSR